MLNSSITSLMVLDYPSGEDFWDVYEFDREDKSEAMAQNWNALVRAKQREGETVEDAIKRLCDK